MRSIRVGLAQVNPVLGDIGYNVKKICDYCEKAKDYDVDLLVFPELSLIGYPPEDLLLKPSFINANLEGIKQIARLSRDFDFAVVVGFADRQDDIYNAAAVIYKGKIVGKYYKMFLPNYGVFDEKRYFQAGNSYPVFIVNGVRVGITICEDAWYPEGPVNVLALDGDAEVIVNLNASPFYIKKWEFREKMLSTRALDNVVPILYVNLVGGQDELVFDGHSMVFNEKGKLVQRGKLFEEDILVADIDTQTVFRSRLIDPKRRERKLKTAAESRVIIEEIEVFDSRKIIRSFHTGKAEPPPPDIEQVYSALVLGTKDYVRKNGFERVVIGLSGGIDSSLVAVIAVDALGKNNVVGVFMPSVYSSSESYEDAKKLADNLGIEFHIVEIQRIFEAYLKELEPHFKETEPNVAEENLQARIRGNILMAFSNKFGYLVLTTGNKSEMSTGYATLYGDMAGGFAVIKDVPKTMVYELARYRNTIAGYDLIPERVLVKPPTAELRPNQKDTDSLPPYEELDPVMRLYVEQNVSPEEIIEFGYDRRLVWRVVNLIDRNEYKRRQAPPGIKVTPRAFGKDWRLPITNKFGKKQGGGEL